MRYKLRRDILVSDDKVCYLAYGINVYDGRTKIKSIKDVSLNKRKLKKFIEKCNRDRIELQHLDDAVQRFVEDEHNVIRKPCFPI